MYTLTADGNTPTMLWDGGEGNFRVQGTFGSGTAKLQSAHPSDPTTFVDVSGGSLSANGDVNFSLPRCFLRVNLAGATSPDLDIGVQVIP